MHHCIEEEYDDGDVGEVVGDDGFSGGALAPPQERGQEPPPPPSSLVSPLVHDVHGLQRERAPIDIGSNPLR